MDDVEDVERARRLGAFGSVVDTEHRITTTFAADGCTHLDQTQPIVPSAPGCEECLALGSRWVHLRVCMTCGQVGCCDSSPHRHACGHHRSTGHPIAASAEPGETWAWCFFDQQLLEPSARVPGGGA